MRLLLLLCLLSLKLAIAGEPARLQFSRVGPTRIGLFLVLADGSNEHALLPANSLDYNPSFSAMESGLCSLPSATDRRTSSGSTRMAAGWNG